MWVRVVTLKLADVAEVRTASIIGLENRAIEVQSQAEAKGFFL
jgi:hypothetical protein